MERITVDVGELADRFPELLAKATGGYEVVITTGGVPSAWLTPMLRPAGPRVPGFATGAFPWVAPDFDAPLPDEFWLGESP